MLFLKNTFFSNCWKMRKDFVKTAAFYCLFTPTWTEPCSKLICLGLKYCIPGFMRYKQPFTYDQQNICWKILSSSLENNKQSFTDVLQNWHRLWSSCEFCEIFMNILFIEHLWPTAFYWIISCNIVCLKSTI